MAAVDDTAAMIDFLLLRWKKVNSTERAKMLKWLQDAEDNIWNASDWWFATDESAITFTISTATVASPAGTARPIHLADASGNPLDHVPYPTFMALYRSSAFTGVPQVWTVAQRTASTGVFTIRLWPIPSAGSAGVLTRKIQQATLTDSGASVSYVPREYRNAHLYYAQWNMALDEGQLAEAKEWETRFKEILGAMAMEDKRQRGEAPLT